KPHFSSFWRSFRALRPSVLPSIHGLVYDRARCNLRPFAIALVSLPDFIHYLHLSTISTCLDSPVVSPSIHLIFFGLIPDFKSSLHVKQCPCSGPSGATRK